MFARLSYAASSGLSQMASHRERAVVIITVFLASFPARCRALVGHHIGQQIRLGEPNRKSAKKFAKYAKKNAKIRKSTKCKCDAKIKSKSASHLHCTTIPDHQILYINRIISFASFHSYHSLTLYFAPRTRRVLTPNTKLFLTRETKKF